MAEEGNEEYDQCLSAFEDICARRSFVNQCRSAIKWLLTEHHDNTAIDPFSPGRLAICFLHLELVKGCMFGGFTGALPLQNKPATAAHAFLLWSLCPCPQRYKRLFICNCGEWPAADCSLFVMKKEKKNMFLIMEPLYCFFLASPSPLFFFLFSPPSLLAEVIAGWLRRWVGRETEERLFFSSALKKAAPVKDWEGLICPVRIGFYCRYCSCMR